MKTYEIGNTDLLLQIAEAIDEEETFKNNFDMRSYTNIYSSSSENGKSIDEAILDLLDGSNRCGTTCCVAGWAVLLSDKEIFKKLAGDDLYHGQSFQDVAADFLDMSVHDAEHLFYDFNGPLNGLTATQALQKIAAGTAIREVWG